MELKYGTWKISSYEPADARALCAAGFSPITAALLCSRGYRDAGAAREFLSCSYPLSSPFALLDMDKAAARVKQALSRREHIAVFGDYDVDGITATCLLTEYLRSKGGHVTSYIPARLEEGYGLNPIAIDTLKKQGVELIVTVDCGITANHEATLCRELGIDLVITDHHECKSELPQALASSTRTGRTSRSRSRKWRASASRSSWLPPSRASRKRFWINIVIFSASARLRTSCPSRERTAQWSHGA